MALRNAYHQFRFSGDLVLAGFEYLGRFVSEPMVLSLAPTAPKKRAVITLPGFTGTDENMGSINKFLGALGYKAESWGLGRNDGYRDREFFEAQLRLVGIKATALAETTGHKVSLIGHSLGGVYAREIARRYRPVIDRVITMGSPAHLGHTRSPSDKFDAAAGTIYAMAGLKKGAEPQAGKYRLTSDEPPPGVPLVSIYSRLDAVVPERSARIPDHYFPGRHLAPVENVEVLCSHMGMALNPLVSLVTADRLAQSVEAWTPFDASHYMPLPMRIAQGMIYPQMAAQASV